MTMTADPIEQHDDEPKGSKTVAWGVIAVVIVAILIAAWFAWTKIFAGPTESGELDIGTIPDRFRPRALVAAPPVPQFKDGVTKAGGNLFRVQSGEYFMVLAPVETSYAPIRLMTPGRNYIGQNDRLPIRFTQEAANAAVAKSLDVTADQAKQLTAIRQQMNGGMKISDDDRNKLRDLWKNWNSAKDPAAKSAAEQALMAAMKDVGNRSMDATKQEYASIAGQIHKVVSDQQLTKYRALRGG
jgi:hypothetical protein